MFKKIIKVLKKWYVITAIVLAVILFFLNITRFPYDPLQLINTGYVEGVVLDNATLPDCHWDNKLMGEGNTCDRHGYFEIVQDNGEHATIHICQMDTLRWFIPAGGSIKICLGQIIGFPLKSATDQSLSKTKDSFDKLKVKHVVSPGDRIRVFGKKTTSWVKIIDNIRVIADKNHPEAFKYSHYYNSDSAFFYVEKVN